MNSELTPMTQDSLRFVHRHPVIAAGLETVGAVGILAALEALGVLAHSTTKELIDGLLAAVLAFPLMASLHLDQAAKAKRRLSAPWDSSELP